jgi:glc operon protein GlcG
MKTWLSTLLCLIVPLTVAVGAQLADKKAMTLEVAKQLAAAAEKEAVNNKWTMVFVILDDGGNLVLLQRMDDTQIGSIDVAVQKARSAISFKRPTKVFEDAVAGGRNAILSLPGAIPIEGGIPITVDGKIIGSIGASGGTSAQDGLAAKAALDALPKILGK